jgi:hypothetical protein
MSEALLDVLLPSAPAASVRLHTAALRMAGRLARLLDALDPGQSTGLHALAPNHDDPFDTTCLGPPRFPPDPVDRLLIACTHTPVEADLLILAGCGHEHEVIAAALRRLHPLGQPAATPGLAAQLAEHGLLPGLPPYPETRPALRALIDASAVLDLQPGPSYGDRNLTVHPDVWSALHGTNTQAADTTATTGLEEWLATPSARAAAAAIAHGQPVAIVTRTDRPDAAAVRAAALSPVHAEIVDHPVDAKAAVLAATARGRLAILIAETAPDLDRAPRPVVVCLPADTPTPKTNSIELKITPLGRRARRRLWDTVAPGTPCPSGLEPVDLSNANPTTADSPCPGATLIHPRAAWADLVLADDATAQLHEAATRGADVHQATVLHQWRFLDGRPGASGLRLLFCGPPGTGKTLAAEVLATELERDLLVVDLSQLVSKWIGETEKNLAAAFDAAERGDCVLFFDEADALFGRRTEVGDARDRYANLETAYLLGRLERFDGVAVLATNLRQNIDAAFGRRLEYVIPFDPPGPEERRRLWERHLPATAPVDTDVDLDALACVYEVVGAHIRNAAVAAAYLAAANGGRITADHLLHALSREYDKSGQAFPGMAPDRFERKEPAWRE